MHLFLQAQAVAGIHNVEVAGYLVLAHCILELKTALETKGDGDGKNDEALVPGEE